MIRRKILQSHLKYYQRSIYPYRNLCLQVRSTLKDNSIEVADTDQAENSQVLRRSKKREFKSIAEYDAFVRKALVILQEDKIQRKKVTNKVNLIALGTTIFAFIIFTMSGMLEVQETMRMHGSRTRQLREMIEAEKRKMR